MSALKQGEFLVESLALINQFGETLDISGVVGEFEMSESIYRKFVSGVVGIVDGLNLLKNYRFSKTKRRNGRYCRCIV